MSLAVILLAAGHGTRMKSKTQKVLHPVAGKPMVEHVFEAARSIADLTPVVVIGAGETGVRELLGERAVYAVQEQRLGTGHATLAARELLAGKASQVLVTYGDMPLLRAETMASLARRQEERAAVMAMLTVRGDRTSSFGRIVRDEGGRVQAIVEVAQARRRDDGEAILAIEELNAGVYCFDAPWLWQYLANLPRRAARSGPEYYLTDMVTLAVRQGRSVEAIIAPDAEECLGAGTRAELAAVERAFRRRINAHWLDAGVTLIDPETSYIGVDAVIGQDTVIWPNTYLQGRCIVAEDCVLGPNSVLRDATVGRGCHVVQSVLEGATLAPGTSVPPFTYMGRQDEQKPERGNDGGTDD
jgi:bifunctional UDP-N-acetylglucosamine pyrophosphorylase/glucosamine-1-phosphate N-acetyltransferase